MNEADIRQLLVEHAASLFARGFSVGSAGNISARLPEVCFCAAAWLSCVNRSVNPYFFISSLMPLTYPPQ